MAINSENPVEDLCCLQLTIEGAEGQESDCIVTVEFGKAELTTEKETYIVSLGSARLSVSLEGCEIIQGTRYGARQLPTEVIQKQTSVEQRGGSEKAEYIGKLSASFAGRVSATTASATGDQEIYASAEGRKLAGHSRFLQNEICDEGVFLRVRAKGSRNWEFQETNARPLDGHFIEAKRLFSIRATPSSNRIFLTASITTKQRDLIFENLKPKKVSSNIFGGDRNRKRIADILRSRGIADTVNLPESEYAGLLTLSLVEVEIEKI